VKKIRLGYLRRVHLIKFQPEARLKQRLGLSVANFSQRWS